MRRSWPGKLGQGLGVIGAALLAAAGLRLMTVAVAWAMEAQTPALVAAPPPKSAPRASSEVAPRSEVNAPVAARTSAPREPSPPTQPLRLMLAISAGAPRSELYVNGSRLGLTPYLGDYACKRGEKLKIEIVPPASGPLVLREAVCEGKTLRLQD